MDRALTFLAGMGVGAGLMYILDPEQGRRRRALTRDKAVRLAHETQDAASVVGRDLWNRAQGFVSGDLSVLAGGRRAIRNPFRGGWSPSGRTLLVGLGTGLFIYGLTRTAPSACILGTLGAGLAAEGITNAGIDDITGAAEKLADKARTITGMACSQDSGSQSGQAQMAGAGV